MSQTTLVSLDSMDEKPQSTASLKQSTCSVATVIIYFLALSSASGMLLIGKYVYFDLFPCPTSAQKVFTPKINWDAATRLSFDEKNVTILRAATKNRCYVIPQTSMPSHKLQLIREVTSVADRYALLGDDGSRFCERETVYLLDVVKDSNRFRRSESQLCKDVLINCAERGTIGEINLCSNENQIIFDKNICQSANQSKTTMQQNKIRIIRHERDLLCVDRLAKGLTC